MGNLAMLYEFTPKPSTKKVSKKQATYEDNFPSTKEEHEAYIVYKPFPASMHWKEFYNLRKEIKGVIYQDSATAPAVALVCEFLQRFRLARSLEIKEFVNPCKTRNAGNSIIEQMMLPSNYVFAKLFDEVGVTYKSWTEYATTKGDRFKGKLLLRINGKNKRETTFRCNPDLATAYAMKLGMTPYKEAK